MSGNLSDRAPTFWMNVTTSSQWTRSPVGIIRAEQEILKEMRAKLRHRVQTVVFQDGEFFPESNLGTGAVSRSDFWPEPSFGSSADIFDPTLSPRAAAILAPTPRRPRFRHGDVLITMGLDWEYPGLHDAIRTLKRQYGLIVVTCCYDLIPILYPQYCVGDVASWFKNYIIDMTWLSDGILCISENTRRDFEEFAQSVGLPARRTEVIKLGSSLPAPNPADKLSTQVSEILDSRYFLFVSTIERRKNHEVLYRAYHLIRREDPDLQLPKLVFVGMQGWGVDGLMSDIQLDPLVHDDIVILSHVSDSELASLYERCDAFLFPSLYEGWGLPVAEALQFGRPVIASDAGSIPEVGGELVRYVDPWSPRDWGNELLKVIKDEVRLADWSAEISKKFEPYDWASAASALIAMTDELRAQTPSERLLEAGYNLSSLNGIHYGDKLIYDGKEGLVCHGPYIGMPLGNHVVTIEWTWISGSSGYLRFIVGHDGGKKRLAVRRLDVQSLEPGQQAIELALDLAEDVTDLELICEAHSEESVKFSIDKVIIRTNALSSDAHSGRSKAESATLPA